MLNIAFVVLPIAATSERLIFSLNEKQEKIIYFKQHNLVL